MSYDMEPPRSTIAQQITAAMTTLCALILLGILWAVLKMIHIL